MATKTTKTTAKRRTPVARMLTRQQAMRVKRTRKPTFVTPTLDYGRAARALKRIERQCRVLVPGGKLEVLALQLF